MAKTHDVEFLVARAKEMLKKKESEEADDGEESEAQEVQEGKGTLES